MFCLERVNVCSISTLFEGDGVKSPFFKKNDLLREHLVGMGERHKGSRDKLGIKIILMVLFRFKSC